jgi:5-amino-6-(5-phosphoribosylamino)uracil reductase
VKRSAEQWRQRFDALVAEKTRAAGAALLEAYVTELDAPDASARAIGNAWSQRLFDGPFYLVPSHAPRRPACSLVFVQSADGNTGATDPATLGGGNTDKHLIYEGLSRVAADAVLAGAGTIGGSGVLLTVWHPELVALRASFGLPRHPVQIVATVRGVDLDAALLFNLPEIRVVLLTVAAAAQQMQPALRERPWVTPLVMPSSAALAPIFEEMHAMGIVRICCIGGRTLAGWLLDAGLVDDVYLTTSARAGGDPDTPLRRAPWRQCTIVRKHGTGWETGVLFEHVLVTRAVATEDDR